MPLRLVPLALIQIIQCELVLHMSSFPSPAICSCALSSSGDDVVQRHEWLEG
jgi:hypothetical protein